MLTAIAVLGAASSGCYHITTHMPGVLDLRSDASEAPTDSKPSKDARSGFDGILWGDGVDGAGTVSVDDRKYWVLGLFPVANESATEEVQSAVGDGALRNITVGEQVTPVDAGVFFCAEPVISFCTLGLGGLLAFVLPAIDFKLTGTRATTIATAVPMDEPPAPPAGE